MSHWTNCLSHVIYSGEPHISNFVYYKNPTSVKKSLLSAVFTILVGQTNPKSYPEKQ